MNLGLLWKKYEIDEYFGLWDFYFSRRRVWSLESSGIVLLKKSARTSETSVNFNVTTGPYIPEDSKLNISDCTLHFNLTFIKLGIVRILVEKSEGRNHFGEL
jgi:hypothetical protein